MRIALHGQEIRQTVVGGGILQKDTHTARVPYHTGHGARAAELQPCIDSFDRMVHAVIQFEIFIHGHAVEEHIVNLKGRELPLGYLVPAVSADCMPQNSFNQCAECCAVRTCSGDRAGLEDAGLCFRQFPGNKAEFQERAQPLLEQEVDDHIEVGEAALHLAVFHTLIDVKLLIEHAVEPQIAEADLLLDFDNLLLNSGGQQMLGVSGVEQGFPRMTKPARLYILINRDVPRFVRQLALRIGRNGKLQQIGNAVLQ